MSSAVNFFRRLDDMLVFRKGDQRAPHKPLYLLYCIAGVPSGKRSLAAIRCRPADIETGSKNIRPRTETAHPEYPFWRLQHDKLAEVFTDGPLTLRKSNSDPTVSSLREQNARGGLLDGDHEMLCGDLQLQSLTVHKILDAHFPASIHDEVVRFFA
jgi:putative restriction endonuclease